jgi:Xaa-Pro dipeptidase
MDIPSIQRALRDEGLDGWLFFDHHRRDPLAYRVLGLETAFAPPRRWYYFIPAEGEPRKLVHRIESGVLDPLPGDKVQYAGWTAQREGLGRILTGHRRIAMQYSPGCAVPYVSMVDAGTLELVRATGVEVASSANLIQFFEARWDQARLDSHLAAGRKIDALRRAAFEFIGDRLRAREHVTEWDIASFIRQGFASEGLVADHGPIVAFNEHASHPHYEPRETGSLPVKAGDVVLIDMWAKLRAPESVYYDITWTGFCGPDPPDALRRIFEIVRGARDAAVERVRTAVAAGETLRGFEVDDAARGHIARHGYAEQFFHRTGHSIGQEVHGVGANMDNLETHDDRCVIPWTCFSVEPGIYLPEFGVRLEVNVFVGDREARVTGEIQRDLVLI